MSTSSGGSPASDSGEELCEFFAEELKEAKCTHDARWRTAREVLFVLVVIGVAVWVLCQQPRDRVLPIAIGVGNPSGDRDLGDPE